MDGAAVQMVARQTHVKVIIDPVFYRRRVLIVAMLAPSCRIPEHFAEDLPFGLNL
jgi:hypothetical protein